MSLPTLYTPQEVADFWKVTRRTVYEWIKTGRVTAYRMGDTVRIPESELTRLLTPLGTGEEPPKKKRGKTSSRKRTPKPSPKR